MKKRKNLTAKEVIEQATLALMDVMDDPDVSPNTRVAAASKLLAIYSKDHVFEEDKEPKQLTLDLALSVRRDIYGIDDA
jgi:hypothetical protein